MTKYGNVGNDRGSREEVMHFMREGGKEGERERERERERENKTLLFLKCRKTQSWIEEQQVARAERENYIEYLKTASPCIIIHFK